MSIATARLARAAGAFAIAHLVTSDAAGQRAPDESAPAFFAEVSSQLANRPGVEVSKPELGRAPSPTGPADRYRFMEFLPAHQQRLNFDMTKVIDVETVVSALQAARVALDAACKPGKLHQRDVPPRITKIVLGHPTDALMSAAYRRVQEEGFVGRFDCTSADGALAWTLTTLWDQGDREPTSVIPSNQWRFRLESVSAARLNRQQLRFEEFRVKTDALRARPDPGTGVQVLLEDLPGSIASQYGRPFNPDRVSYFVCGLVLSYREGIAEVQFGKDRIALQPTKLYPIGNQVSVAEMGMYMEAKSPPHKTCLRA